MSDLVLSLFPGIGILDRAFEEAGFCVARGPDLLWGGNIKNFHPPAGRFSGIIGGEVQSRKHRFAFGTRDGRKLHYATAPLENPDWDYRVCASDWRRTPVKKLAGGVDKRTRKGSLSSRGRERKLPEALELQGLPRDFFDNSPFTMKGKGEMLGNAVPLFMARALADAVKRALAQPGRRIA